MIMLYSVYTEDGEHADKVDSFNTMFDALACYYECVNDGPVDGDRELEGIELAIETDDSIESIDYHEF